MHRKAKHRALSLQAMCLARAGFSVSTVTGHLHRGWGSLPSAHAGSAYPVSAPATWSRSGLGRLFHPEEKALWGAVERWGHSSESLPAPTEKQVGELGSL